MLTDFIVCQLHFNEVYKEHKNTFMHTSLRNSKIKKADKTTLRQGYGATLTLTQSLRAHKAVQTPGEKLHPLLTQPSGHQS